MLKSFIPKEVLAATLRRIADRVEANKEEIVPLLQLLSFSFIINSIGNQYRVLLRKELKFNILAFFS